MRVSQQLTTTLREAPHDSEGGNQELLLRAGFIRQLATGVYSYETAGVKFNDADLIGLPLRVVVSKRSLKNGGAELKLRSQKESRIVPLTDVVQVIQDEIHSCTEQSSSHLVV